MRICGWVPSAQIDGRYFPLSDHHIRGYSIIGEAERCIGLFQQLYDIILQNFRLAVSAICFLWLWDVNR